MTEVLVVSEVEQPAGWLFEIQWTGPREDDAGHTSMSLAWADYNHWSASGTDEPSSVAAAVVRFWLDQRTNIAIPKRFDAAIVRRRFPNADDIIPMMIG